MQNNIMEVVEKQDEYKAIELKNVKKPEAFDPDYIPLEVLVRDEAEEIINPMIEFARLRSRRYVVVYGLRGTGKTLTIKTICDALQKRYGILKWCYVNVRENDTAYKIYSAVIGHNPNQLGDNNIREKADSTLDDNTILVLDEVDFLKDLDVLYHITNSLKCSMILLSQDPHWFSKMKDDSVKSRMAGTEHVSFSEYDSTQIKEILSLRAKEALDHYDEEGVALLSSKLNDAYHSDMRIAIKALQLLGSRDNWTEETIDKTLRYASDRVEVRTIKTLKDNDLLVLSTIMKIPDTNQALVQVNRSSQNMPMKRKISKSSFFRSLAHLQNLNLILTVKKGKTLEIETLIGQEEAVFEELKRRFNP
jgi:Cdc6-like AAA superfamily ATPase